MTSTDCRCTQHKHSPSSARTGLTILSGIIIAILPKCPFCVLAYGSALTLCSGAKIYQHAPNWASYISIALAILTLGLILWNYKGRRTLAAAAMIIAGSVLLIDSELRTGELTTYYWGVAFLLIGVWVNGSFRYFYRRFFRPVINKIFGPTYFHSTKTITDDTSSL